jgi:hypothetical protein
MLFRLYEVPQEDLADKVSINTNSQSAVKARDFRANDTKVTALKSAYEETYPDGYFITQRGQKRPADRDADKTVEMVELAKCLMTWHCQRPNEAYSETKLFDKYFNKLFPADYPPREYSYASSMVPTHRQALGEPQSQARACRRSDLFQIPSAFCGADLLLCCQ